MSVRRVYSLLLDGRVIANGSLASVRFAYDACLMILLALDAEESHNLVIAFTPV